MNTRLFFEIVMSRDIGDSSGGGMGDTQAIPRLVVTGRIQGVLHDGGRPRC